MSRAILVSGDLFFGSKLSGAAGMAGVKLETVRDVADLRQTLSANADGVTLVLLDLTLSGLNLAGAVETVRAAVGDSARVIAYGPHVLEGALQAAEEAGCDDVLTRGALNARLGELFRG
jgi:CheY-like chemotaxis protein